MISAGLAMLLLGGCGGDDGSPTAEAPDLGSAPAEQARTCLADAGFEVLGGRSSPDDRDAPDVELTFGLDGGQVFIAFYGDSREAASAEPEIRNNARDFGGLVERQGSVTVVWSEPPAGDSREVVEGCAFA